MVFIRSVLYKNKSLRNHFRPNFLDSLRLTIKGGHGGNGLPKYGGVGGQGGCVYFTAKNDISLKKIQHKFPTKRITAGNGEDASKNRILGIRGNDICIEVPPGITVIDEGKNRIISDLNEEGMKCLGASGGVGGCSGNNFLGKPGQTMTVKLDLKLIADVGLVGFPNAGKSTFLKAISKASPKIASYPFTTIRPQIGMIDYDDFRQISVADLPGLIEGAHANIGLGHKFLKHVERTRLLLLIVDIFGFQLNQNHKKRNCLENVYSLNRELELYDPSLLEKPCVLVVNKMDLDGSSEELKKLEKYLYNLQSGLELCSSEIRPEKLLEFDKIIPISAMNNKNTELVKESLRNILYIEAEKQLKDISNTELDKKIVERGPRVI